MNGGGGFTSVRVPAQFTAKVYYKEDAYLNPVFHDDFYDDGMNLDNGFLITYDGVEYTAKDLAKYLDITILCINTGADFGNSERNIAFSMNEGNFAGQIFRNNYCLVSLSMSNPNCPFVVLCNPDIIDGGSDTAQGDYARNLQLGSPNMNMTFDGVRERFGLSNLSWGRYIDNGTSTSANASAGQQVITTNYDGASIFLNPSLTLQPFTYYGQSGVGIRTLSVVDFNNNQYEIDPYTPSDIQAKYPNSLMERLGFTFRQLANYKGFPHVLFTQKTYESAKPTTFPTYFPYPLTTNYRFDTAKNIGLSVNNHNLPMFNLSTQREYKNINLSASSDTAFAVNLPIKAETPFYLVKSDIFEGDVAFNSENGGSTENIMIICNKAYTNLDYGYSFGTQYSFKATKSFVISGIKTSILKPDLTPADIDKGTAVIYKVVSPIKYFEEQAEAEQLQNKKLSNKGGEGKK